ncbi:hypothetical protein BV22DRAFT_52794 [Leucogyrophana mollusca]|uniref:Uncharacterized protein n=1 Tax=Leucogyrophana mollusca TaxID=85980 RepID=A0ACB8BY19_9AGAM|nr:hypothetical protein BV22DRAFT_52794 [Leucogyrophana mollusca]
MSPSLDDLPPELYSAILDQLPLDWRIVQQTLLSLTRAVPRSPIPIYQLFERVCIKNTEQAVQLYRRLRGATEEASWVHNFALEAWTVDADVIVNLLSILPQISVLCLFIGPNFSPEHLEEIFEKPRSTVSHLSLRFRPYVQRATYYQFLKVHAISRCISLVLTRLVLQGAYYDTTLHALARWPPYSLPTLSIIQDPLDPEIARGQHFAQPLVFFRLDPLTVLVCSAFARSLTSLRLRIPSRQVARFLCSSPSATPALELLDLSTCNVSISDMEAILIRYTNLKHLILDGCNITRGEVHEGEWVAVGKTCALAPVKRAKEREKKLKTWLEANARASTSDLGQQQTLTVQHTGRRIRPGRRGLATAAISLRDSPPKETIALPVAANLIIPRIRVLPSSPALLSFSTSSHAARSDRHESIRADFAQGWAEGLAQLTAVRTRLRQSWQNNIRVVRFEGDIGLEEGLDGLVDVESERDFVNDLDEGNTARWEVPILCLAGEAGQDHAECCGHSGSESTWKDRIVAW